MYGVVECLNLRIGVLIVFIARCLVFRIAKEFSSFGGTQRRPVVVRGKEVELYIICLSLHCGTVGTVNSKNSHKLGLFCK